MKTTAIAPAAKTAKSSRSHSRLSRGIQLQASARPAFPADGRRRVPSLSGDGRMVIEVIDIKPRAHQAAMARRLNELGNLGVQPSAVAGLAAMFEEASKSKSTPMMAFNGQETPIADVMKAARAKSPDAMYALNALRVENVDMYVRATLDLSAMFEIIDLENTDQAFLDQTYMNPVNVRFAGEDGGTREVKAVKARQQTFINMRELHSDTFGYPMRDINLGSTVEGQGVEAAAQGTVDVAWDVKHKMNMELLSFINGGTINGTKYGAGIYTNFNFNAGNPLTRTLVLHPSLLQGGFANLPTTNLITYAYLASTYGKAANGFDFNVLKAIIQYTEGFRGVFADGDLEPTGLIYIPSSEVTGLLSLINPTGQFYNKVGETVLNSFTKVEYGGRVWTLVGSPLLTPGACYPIFNKKVGNIYFKKKLDFEHTESYPLKNREERTMVKVWNYASLAPWFVHGMKVVYTNTVGAGAISTI